MSQKNLISIAIADRHPLIQEGIASMVNTLNGFKVSLMAANGAELIKKIEASETPPDICLIELNMPELNGYQTTLIIKERWPSVKVVAVTQFDSDSSLLNITSRGAAGFISKQNDLDGLTDTLLGLTTDPIRYQDNIGQRLHAIIRNSSVDNFLLTDEQLEFLTLCSSVKQYSEIAAETGKDLKDLEKCQRSLFKHFKVKQRGSLILRAAQMGLLPYQEPYTKFAHRHPTAV